jgi:hypothetical protein
MSKKKNMNINTGYDNPTTEIANTMHAEPVRQSGDPATSNRPRGRPSKDPGELRSERLSVAVTRQELADMQDIAIATGLGTSEIIRTLIQRLIADQDMENVRAKAREREASKLTI